MFIKFEEYGQRRRIAVNANHVIRVSADGDYWADLHMSDGKLIKVRGSVDVVCDLLAEATVRA